MTNVFSLFISKIVTPFICGGWFPKATLVNTFVSVSWPLLSTTDNWSVYVPSVKSVYSLPLWEISSEILPLGDVQLYVGFKVPSISSVTRCSKLNVLPAL